MILTYLHGYPDRVGRRFIWAAVGVPPVATPATGSDPLLLPSFGNYIDSVEIALSVSQSFRSQAFPSQAGARALWYINYVFNTTGSSNVVLATAGSGQTPGTYPITFGGGTLGAGGKAASGTVTVGAGGTITSVNVQPGYGYTTTPTTATISGTGGTPGTLTASASAIGAKVPAGTNLSAEQFQVSGFGGTY